MKLKSYKQLDEIVTNYFVYKEKFKVLSFSSGQLDFSNPYYIYYRDVELALSRLDDNQKLIIKNDYFELYDRMWWKLIFTKTEYVREKRKAIRNFVRYFYEIH